MEAAAFTASSTLDRSRPPAMAMSGRPPPFPPQIFATSRTTSPALTPPDRLRAAVAAKGDRSLIFLDPG